ncbi:MAG: hypothetical protein KFB96_11910 [Thiocapsa sp.]|uniref:hypothetical protein n=1 Tax=Thiocapsa sp. TaxID=2024551 RepID=UPI001BCFE4D8|nr:hypothetical protein [Thiocapsa sp.]QVL51042.1 MAG: hypothetical protein KFB96_11910 [Thiocapsa sp.]
MFQVHSIRIATVAALGVLLVLSGTAPAGQALKESAAAELEVRVLEAQMPTPQGEHSDVLYRMEVISVLRSASPVTPGDSITVRSYALSQEARDRGVVGPKILAPGWLGIAYLNPDPETGGPDSGRQFTIAADGDSFEDIPPGPPSLRWTEDVEVRAE